MHRSLNGNGNGNGNGDRPGPGTGSRFDLGRGWIRSARRGGVVVLVVLLAPALALVGCGGSSGTGDAGVQADLGAGETCVSDGKPIALAARYAIQGRLNVNIKVPGDCTEGSCIFDKDARAGLMLLAEVKQSGTSMTIDARTCQIQLPPVALKGQPMPTQLTVSDALVQAIPAVKTTAVLSGDRTCARMTSMPLAIILGTRLGAGTSDPLPTWDGARSPPVKLCGGKVETRCAEATDSGCICDQEGDGKPGATVAASGFPVYDDIDQLYLGLRNLFALDGAIYPQGPQGSQGGASGQSIRGKVTGVSIEQSPIGCHRAGVGGGGASDCDATVTRSVTALNPRITQSANTPSSFIAVPVGEGVDCAAVVAQAGTLFANP